MSAGTSIEWTDATWNPVRGCTRVSEGCTRCYAERMAARMSGPGQWGEGFADRARAGSKWTGKVALIPEKLAEPLRWRKPRRIFVNSMSDLFHESLPDEAIDRVLGAIVMAPQHTYQILTKRPGRMRAYFTDENVWARIEARARRLHYDTCPACQRADGQRRARPHLGGVTLRDGPYPCVWLGVSVEDQATADRRVPELLQTPAAVRFVSYEPALAAVDFSPWVQAHELEPDLDWVIVGGESGPGARPFDLAWARSTLRQCREAGVPVFLKQLGTRPHSTGGCHPGLRGCDHPSLSGGACDCCGRLPGMRDRKGGDPTEWSEDLRVRQWPKVKR